MSATSARPSPAAWTIAQVYYRLGSSSCAGEGDRAWNDARAVFQKGTKMEAGKGGDRPVVRRQSPGDCRRRFGMGTPLVSGEKPSLQEACGGSGRSS